MRIPSDRTRDDRRDGMAMTPMIDVVFLLLIFFVCASIGQKRESLLPTELGAGSVRSEEVVEQQNPLGEVWVHLRTPEGTAEPGPTVVELNDREYTEFDRLQATLTKLAELAPEIPVILDIANDVPLGDVIRVYDTCRDAHFQSIHFAAEPE